MNNAFLFHYNTAERDEKKDFHIRGIGVHEKMPPGMIRHGDEHYPWLFIFFHSPAVVRTPSGSLKCDHSLIIWEPRQFHDYGNESGEWDHSWLIVKSWDLQRFEDKDALSSYRIWLLHNRAFFYFPEKFSPPQTGEFFKSLKMGYFHYLEKFSGRNLNFILPQKRV